MVKHRTRSWTTLFVFALAGASAPGRTLAAELEAGSRNLLGPTILVDNGEFVTHPGGGFNGADASMLQTTALAMTIFGFGHSLASGFRVADDFTVADPGGWDVQSITFFSYQTGSSTTSTINHLNLRIWDGPPNDVGSTIIFGDTATNRFSSTSWTNAYRVTETTLTDSARPIMATIATAVIHLDPGTYWLDWQTGGTLGSGPWAPPVTTLGSTTTGNALQFDPGTAVWSPAMDVGQQGMPFVVTGLVFDTMPFLDDFESGDTSAWSFVQN